MRRSLAEQVLALDGAILIILSVNSTPHQRSREPATPIRGEYEHTRHSDTRFKSSHSASGRPGPLVHRFGRIG